MGTMQGRWLIAFLTVMGAVVGIGCADEPEYPAHVQHLLDGISPAGQGPEATIRRFNQGVSVAQGVPADVCIVRLAWPNDLSEADLRRLDRLETLSATERQELLDRTREHTIQVWWVPLAYHPALGEEFRTLLRPYPIAGEEPRPIVYLGNDGTYAWYVAMGTMRWGLMQQALGLTGGDDPVACAEAHLDAHGPTSAVTRRCMITIGFQPSGVYMEVTDRLIFNGSPHRAGMIAMAANHGDPEITRWLEGMTQASDSVVAQAAREVLLNYPRVDAEETYLAWLDADAGNANVEALLSVFQALELPSVAPYLDRVLASPDSIAEYLQAYRLQRELADNPIDETVDLAAAYIRGERNFLTEDVAGELSPLEQAERAVHVMTNTSDQAGAVALAVPMAMSSDETVCEVGLYVLASTADRSGRVLVERLKNTCEDTRDVARLRRVYQVLTAWENAQRPGGTPRLRAFARRAPGGGPARPGVRPTVNIGRINIGRGGGGPSGAGPTRVQPH
jgi:hypothetical protein